MNRQDYLNQNLAKNSEFINSKAGATHHLTNETSRFSISERKQMERN